MTHKELLAKIDTDIEDINADYGLVKGMYALRAVVELHQPIYTFIADGDKSVPLCIQCRDGDFIADYPCNTIQAIEKELI